MFENRILSSQAGDKPSGYIYYFTVQFPNAMRLQYAYKDRLLNDEEENVRHSFHEPYETQIHSGQTDRDYVMSGGTWSYNVAF